MRITKEMINKLSKNKQIELKTRLKAITEDLEFFPFTMAFIKYCVYIFSFSLLVIPLWKLAYPSIVINIVTVFGVLTTVILKIIPIAFLLESIGYLFLMLKEEKIKAEYFTKKIEVKK